MTNQDIGRLAFRVDGDQWVASYALPGTMEGALRLGAVHMSIVEDPRRKKAFMDLMKSFLADYLKKTHGTAPKFRTQPAPEHERKK